MALTHLADTSVLTRLDREPVRRVLRELIASRNVAICRMSRLEIGFSARNGPEWDRLLGAVSVLAPVEVESADLRRAEQVQRALAEAGLRGRKVPALVVAAVAVTVLHYDRDFELVARVTGQGEQWVVPAGTID